MSIEITNITPAQKLALEDLFAQWAQLGAIGSSRWTGFYADGDGNFRPQIKVDGHRANFCELSNPKDCWRDIKIRSIEFPTYFHPTNAYLVDFDQIAWALRHGKKEAEIV